MQIKQVQEEVIFGSSGSKVVQRSGIINKHITLFLFCKKLVQKLFQVVKCRSNKIKKKLTVDLEVEKMFNFMELQTNTLRCFVLYKLVQKLFQIVQCRSKKFKKTTLVDEEVQKLFIIVAMYFFKNWYKNCSKLSNSYQMKSKRS